MIGTDPQWRAAFAIKERSIGLGRFLVIEHQQPLRQLIGQLKGNPGRADFDLVAVGQQPAPGGGPVIEFQAGARTVVGDVILTVFAIEPGVDARHRDIVDNDVVGRSPPDQHPALQPATDLSIGLLDNECRHVLQVAAAALGFSWNTKVVPPI